MATKQEILDVLRRARERIADPTRWCRVNDSCGHGAVLELYDRAIADAEAAVLA